MINSMLNKSVAVFGLGKSGMAVVRELKQRGIHIIAWDNNENLRNQAAQYGASIQNLIDVDFSSIEFLVISPGIPHTYPEPHPIAKKAKDAGVKIIDDIELFVSTYTQPHYIGITGSNGKSTTCALVYHILKENDIETAIGGNFGIPVFDLPQLSKDGWYVLEMSSYQLELTPSMDFDVAAILNITPDHLSRHNGLEGYINAKEKIFNRKTKKDVLNVVAVDDEHTKKIFKNLSQNSNKSYKTIPVSFDKKVDGFYVNNKGILIDNTKNEKKEIFDLNELENLNGKHNWQNILVAFAICKYVGLSVPKIIKALKTFAPLEHRAEYVKNIMGVDFINDSKATNADATKYTIQSLNDVYWIIGGRKKEGGIDLLIPELSKGYIKRIFTIGECEKEFYNQVKKSVPSYKCHKLDKAVNKAFKLALKDLKKGSVKNPVILLSPACASFDQYNSFEQRGKVFKNIVEQIYLKYNKD